jgi:hypothetical protein
MPASQTAAAPAGPCEPRGTRQWQCPWNCPQPPQKLARFAGELALSGSERMRSDSATAIARQCTAAFADLTP